MNTAHLDDCNVNFGNIDTQLFLVGYLNAFNNRFQAAGDSFLGSISWKQVFMLHIPFASCHLHGKILPLCR